MGEIKFDEQFIVDGGRDANDCSFMQNNGIDHLKGVKVIGNTCYDFNGEEINVIEETYRTFYYI